MQAQLQTEQLYAGNIANMTVSNKVKQQSKQIFISIQKLEPRTKQILYPISNA